MTVVTSPPCPDCRQPYTGRYRGRHGCARCVRLGPVIVPKITAPIVVQPVSTSAPVLA